MGVKATNLGSKFTVLLDYINKCLIDKPGIH